MKETKFKIWDNGFMSEPFHIRDVCTKQNYIKPGVLFLQYIGIKDKNGKEIYEGDYVKSPNGVGEVRYYEDIYAFQIGLSGCVLDQECGIDLNNLEIIGNIYQTLKKG